MLSKQITPAIKITAARQARYSLITRSGHIHTKVTTKTSIFTRPVTPIVSTAPTQCSHVHQLQQIPQRTRPRKERCPGSRSERRLPHPRCCSGETLRSPRGRSRRPDKEFCKGRYCGKLWYTLLVVTTPFALHLIGVKSSKCSHPGVQILFIIAIVTLCLASMSFHHNQRHEKGTVPGAPPDVRCTRCYPLNLVSLVE